MRYTLLLALSCMACCCFSQKREVKLEGTPYRPRIAEFTVTTLYDYQSTSDSETFGNYTSEIEVDQKMKVRLGIPIVMKENTLMGVQLKYDNHDFLVEFEDPQISELYQHIQDKRFMSLGGRFLLSKEIAEGKNLTVLAGTEIKSDKLEWNANTTKTYGNVNYKVEKNNDVTIGGGIAVSYTLKTPQIYPMFFYENRISSKWTVDLALPKAAIMRLKINHKCYLSFKAEVKGWRYAFHNSKLSEEEPLTLRKSDVHLGLNFEHEIHDWLWLGIDAGLSKNLRNYVARPGDRRRDAIIDLTANDAPYTKFSLFIVPPKKIYN